MTVCPGCRYGESFASLACRSKMPPLSDETLHYETHSLRDELMSSNVRVLRARTHVGLVPHQGPPQDWEPPPQGDFDSGSPANLSGQPWWEELRDSLARFESTQHWTAPTKNRAFFSALRSLLSEIAADMDPASQAARLRAAHTWWAKHRPRGRAGNPAAAAALASSLAIPAGSLAMQAGVVAGGMRMGSSTLQGAGDSAGTAGLPPPGPLSLSGTKHEFFAAFTKGTALQGIAPSSGPVPITAPGRLGGSSSGKAPGPGPAAAHMPVSRLAAVQSGSGAGRSMHGLPRSSGAPQVQAKAHAAVAEPEGEAPLQATGPTIAPRNKARVVFDPDRLEAPPGPLPNTQGKAPSWFQGPFRQGAPATGSVFQGSQGTNQPGRGRGTQQGVGEDASVAALRHQQAVIQEAALRSSRCIEKEMASWASQRARLEEEMVRRQESSRYALPSTRHNNINGNSSGGGWAAGATTHDDVSAYAGVTKEMFNSLAAGHQDLASAPDALRLVPGLAPAPTTAAAAQEERAHAAGVFEHEARQIAAIMQQLGIVGSIRPAAMLKALGPVPDKPYLECIARLPRPGEYLPSRPGSVRAGASGSSCKSKSKGEGSGGKRPYSK